MYLRIELGKVLRRNLAIVGNINEQELSSECREGLIRKKPTKRGQYTGNTMTNNNVRQKSYLLELVGVFSVIEAPDPAKQASIFAIIPTNPLQ
jgi:hypothetical protein